MESYTGAMDRGCLLFIRRHIICTNCDYRGKARAKGVGVGWWALVLLAWIAACVFWLLLPVAILLTFVLFVTKHVCPACGWEKPMKRGMGFEA